MSCEKLINSKFIQLKTKEIDINSLFPRVQNYDNIFLYHKVQKTL